MTNQQTSKWGTTFGLSL